MRGTLILCGLGLGRMRIIPADAGNTSLPEGSSEGGRDHPRGCGEHDVRIRVLILN